MVYVRKFFERNFYAHDSKTAYMKACKFVATNVISEKSKVEVERVTWDIVNVTSEENGLPTFRLSLYYKFDDTEFMEETCKACKQFHKSFFINEAFNCNRCNKVGYEKNVNQKLMTGSEYFKELLDDALGQYQ